MCLQHKHGILGEVGQQVHVAFVQQGKDELNDITSSDVKHAWMKGWEFIRCLFILWQVDVLSELSIMVRNYYRVMCGECSTSWPFTTQLITKYIVSVGGATKLVTMRK